LSENSDFARLVTNGGMVFVGPSPESIESFGLKHTARELATKAGVPTVPGTKELVKNEEDAVQEAMKLGFPVTTTRVQGR
jgi:urea carboxylase